MWSQWSHTPYSKTLNELKQAIYYKTGSVTTSTCSSSSSRNYSLLIILTKYMNYYIANSRDLATRSNKNDVCVLQNKNEGVHQDEWRLCWIIGVAKNLLRKKYKLFCKFNTQMPWPSLWSLWHSLNGSSNPARWKKIPCGVCYSWSHLGILA